MSNAFAARQWATMKLFEGVSRHKGKVLISLVITTLAMSLLLVAFTLSLTAYNSVKGVSVAQEMTIFTNQGVSSERAANGQHGSLIQHQPAAEYSARNRQHGYSREAGGRDREVH